MFNTGTVGHSSFSTFLDMYSFNCNNFYSIRCSSVNIIRLLLDGDIITIVSDNLKLVSINRYQVSNIAIYPIFLIVDTSIKYRLILWEDVLPIGKKCRLDLQISFIGTLDRTYRDEFFYVQK